MERSTACGMTAQKEFTGFKFLLVLGLVLAGIFRPALGETAPSSKTPAFKANSSRPHAPEPAAAESLATSGKFEVEWSQGEPFVGATDGSTTATHGCQKLEGAQPATALLPPSSGLSLVGADRGTDGYRIRFDEARLRYFVKLFGPEGRVLRIYVVYPDQAELSIPYARLPAGPVFLSVHNEAGHPLQNFKLPFSMDAADTLKDIAGLNGI
jgi:hypothetical protein